MARIHKFLKPIYHLICLIFISYYITQTPFNRTRIIKKKLIRYLPDIKYLLIWTEVHGLNANGQSHFIDKKCPNINCYLTSNRSIFGDLRYFDGIIFNLQDVSEGSSDLPGVRGLNQKYIFAANDSSDNYPVCDSVFDDFFNWTWTYRSVSTIPYRFTTTYNLPKNDLDDQFTWTPGKTAENRLKSDLSSKSKAAAIFLDKCKTRSKREDFLKDLQNHLAKYNMTVDVFGKCGTMECRRKTMKPCFFKLKKYYFFYLAFEDSLAMEYVTKGILYAYNNNAVPIVYGKAYYKGYLPPDSYIDGLALGAEKLARTMHEIISDSRRYQQFFKWKGSYSIKESKVLDACTLCTYLNNQNWLIHKVVYKEFRKWWNPDFEERCREMMKYLRF